MKDIKVVIQEEPFNETTERDLLTTGRGDVGALVTFTGVCRADDELVALELEHYPGMAEDQIKRIVDQAKENWPLLGATVIHRVGRIAVGEPIVFVATISGHRQAAFASADFIMDFLKSRAPFWKKEHGKDGHVGAWVDAKESDEAALNRWR